MRSLLFIAGVLLLLVPEILRVYFIMPFPGSQEDVPTDLHQVDLAYWLHHNIWWVRLIGFALVIGPFWYFWRHGRWLKRIAIALPLLLSGLVIYAFNFKFMADKMFYPPKVKHMLPVLVVDSTANSLVIAVERNGDARAYPIELIGFHHQVLDTIGGEPTMITYCTVCRTGRAWKPVVNGQQETFRLVGMDHFNAMFEDSRTKSWWRQVSGECIEGPLKGAQLEEVPSRQMTLKEFSITHPNGLVFQPDSNFTEQYAGLKGFDDGTLESSLEYRDTASWQPKSWVVGVVHKGQARAYDWNALLRLEEIRDTLAGDTIVMRLGVNSIVVDDSGFMKMVPDSASFSAQHDVERDGFVTDSISQEQYFVQVTTSEPIPAYQEFWHSWHTFHPNTTRYTPH